MAGGMELGTGGRGKKRSLDAAINLVPFIDLMAVMISFLIMTAVWTQAGRLEVTHQGAAAGDDSPDSPRPPKLTLTLAADGVRLGGDALPEERWSLDVAEERLKAARERLSENPQVTVTADDDVPYGDLVRLVDACVGAGLEEVSVEAG